MGSFIDMTLSRLCPMCDSGDTELKDEETAEGFRIFHCNRCRRPFV